MHGCGMDVYKMLREITESKELKTATTVTERIKNSAERLLSLDEYSLLHKFATSMDKALTALVGLARNSKSFTSKLDKLYPMFHNFSINKGFELCSNCEKAIGHEVPETLWLMLMEK